jgi:hypothetical protein
MTFGVPVQSLPLDLDGHLKTTNHAKWIARRQVRDELVKKTGRFDGIDLPAMNDVLLGRGKTFHQHPGSILMRNMVELEVEQFREASPQEKAKLAGKVVAAVKKGGGRILERRKDGWWFEITDDSARDKVSSSFRTILSKAKESKAPASRNVDGVKRIRIGD